MSTLFLRSGMSQILRRLCSMSALEDLGLAPGAGDLLLGPGAELVGAHGEGLGDRALGQDLEAVAQVLDHPPLHEDLGGDDGAGVEDLEALQVDLRELLLEARVGEAPLGHPAVQRHLAALETLAVAEAAAALLPLLTPPRRLAQAAARTATHALALADAALGGPQVAQSHFDSLPQSTMATRCGTFFTMPRTAGVSTRSTTWFRRRRPRPRTVSRCLSGQPITLPIILIFKVPADPEAVVLAMALDLGLGRRRGGDGRCLGGLLLVAAHDVGHRFAPQPGHPLRLLQAQQRVHGGLHHVVGGGRA